MISIIEAPTGLAHARNVLALKQFTYYIFIKFHHNMIASDMSACMHFVYQILTDMLLKFSIVIARFRVFRREGYRYFFILQF